MPLICLDLVFALAGRTSGHSKSGQLVPHETEDVICNCPVEYRLFGQAVVVSDINSIWRPCGKQAWSNELLHL